VEEKTLSPFSEFRVVTTPEIRRGCPFDALTVRCPKPIADSGFLPKDDPGDTYLYIA
jgi:hypothetical protein